jgi:thiamine pyrophosphokinase
MKGKASWRVSDELALKENTCSLIPLGKGACCVSSVGMKYLLSDHDIVPGSSFTVSNEFDMEEKEHGFDMKDGTMLVIVTPKV